MPDTVHADPRTARRAAMIVAWLVLGVAVGALIGLLTPSHVAIAGADARITVEFGRGYDELDVSGALVAKRGTERSVLGEPVGVRVVLDIDPSVFTTPDGALDTDILPAYVQAYSDPEQLVADARQALLTHVLWCAAAGATVALGIVAALWWYRRWRRNVDRTLFPDPADRRVAVAYRRPDRRLAIRAGGFVVMVVVLAAVPSSARHAPAPFQVRTESVLAGTPLADIEIDGLLRPALLAARDYIETYFDQTNAYYDELRTKLLDQLDRDPVQLPGDDGDVVRLGFVSDRHCNIGMDRVIIGLLDHFDIHTLVSGGDDAFSGSFGFESSCTSNLAAKSADSDIADVFVAGNHDSPATIAAEDVQGITTLTAAPRVVNGVSFIGSPDPRTSRYGQGIVPSASAAQAAVVTKQGRAVGERACTTLRPIVAVLHDPRAGSTALQNGCNRIVLALDGHTHRQAGPTAIALPDGSTGYQFTSASSGGAPTDAAIERSFASRLTVGPLNHAATVNIVTIDKDTSRLVGITEFTFTPDQVITVTEQTVG